MLNIDIYIFFLGGGCYLKGLPRVRHGKIKQLLHNYQLTIVFDIMAIGKVLKSVHKHIRHGFHYTDLYSTINRKPLRI